MIDLTCPFPPAFPRALPLLFSAGMGSRLVQCGPAMGPTAPDSGCSLQDTGLGVLECLGGHPGQGQPFSALQLI